MALTNRFSLTVVGSVLLVYACYFAYVKYAIHKSRKAFASSHGCKKGTPYPVKEPIIAGDYVYKIIKAMTENRSLEFFDEMHGVLGNTYTITCLRGGSIWTNEPENVKAVQATQFDQWSVRKPREAFRDLLGDSIFTTDGAAWSHQRALLRPIFVRDSISDLSSLEEHLQSLLALVPIDGSTIDLQDLFSRYSLDTSTDLLFGESARSLLSPRGADGALTEMFDAAMTDAIRRANIGILYSLFRPKAAINAIKHLRGMVDGYVSSACCRVESEKVSGDISSDKSNGRQRYSFLEESARADHDPISMTNNALALFFAGRDTTASLLSNLWFLLARHPAVWEKLAREVDELEGQIPSYEWLRAARYLRFCTNETLRLLPPLPMMAPRVANKDTYLPLGGGPDGKSPLFVPEGVGVLYNLHSSFRRRDIWGADADDFRPERWADTRVGWDFIPFSGGPRICIGQQFALTETYFVTVRLMQHYSRIENRDPEMEYKAKVRAVMSSGNGVQVGLFPRERFD